jgi:60 kDa SS-A/Ro ribonucleoprotein
MAHIPISCPSILKVDIHPEFKLRRSLFACILWDKAFTEDGVGIAERIRSLITVIKSEQVMPLLQELGSHVELHRAHLMLIREMARVPAHQAFVGAALREALKEPNDIREFLSIYWRDGKQPLSAQVKKALSAAFARFSGYQVVSAAVNNGTKLRDAISLCHPKPADIGQEIAWGQLTTDQQFAFDNSSELPVSSVVGGHWEQLLQERRLEPSSLLRNLQRIKAAKVEKSILNDAISRLAHESITPFDVLPAMRCAPEWRAELEHAMVQSLAREAPLSSGWALVVDIHNPGSLVRRCTKISRGDCAFGLAISLHALAKHAVIYELTPTLRRLYPYRSLAMLHSMHWDGQTWDNLQTAVEQLCSKHDRTCVISDRPAPHLLGPEKTSGVFMNIAARELEISYTDCTRIDGWSNRIIHYLRFTEGPI